MSATGSNQRYIKYCEITEVGLIAEKVVEDKLVIPAKRKNNYINAKSKRLRVENEDMMELMLTYKEAQSLIRAPAKIVPSSSIVDGCEFEEFEVLGICI